MTICANSLLSTFNSNKHILIIIEINNDNMNTNINITCALYHKDMWYSAQVKKAEYIIN